jgi:hypothetical protein
MIRQGLTFSQRFPLLLNLNHRQALLTMTFA